MASRILALAALSLAGLSWTSPASGESSGAGPYSPGKARNLSFVPGLGQHYVGSHAKGWIQEGLFVGGLVMVLTAGGGDGERAGNELRHDDGSIHRLRDEYGNYGDYGYYDEYSGSGDGGGRDTAMTVLGASFMVAGVAWSVIDAPRTARRRNAELREEIGSTPPSRPSLALAAVPDLDGMRAGVRWRF